MNEKILISVIMPVYNTEEAMLREAIESILNQSYRNFEFIIINDASDENTTAIIDTYKDKRIHHIINEKNLGITKSLNRGLDLVTGKYIARMDSDDISLPQRFERQLEYMEKNRNVAVLGSVAQIIGEDTVIFHRYSEDYEVMRIRLSFSNVGVIHPTAFLRREMVGKLRYDEGILKGQDYEFWTRCIECGELKVLPEILLKYRIHTNQISVKSNAKQAEYTDVIRLRMLEHVGHFTDKEKQLYLALCKQNPDYKLSEYRKLVKKLVKENKKSHRYNTRKYILELRLLLLYIARMQRFRNGGIAVLEFLYPTTLFYFMKQRMSAEHQLDVK